MAAGVLGVSGRLFWRAAVRDPVGVDIEGLDCGEVCRLASLDRPAMPLTRDLNTTTVTPFWGFCSLTAAVKISKRITMSCNAGCKAPQSTHSATGSSTWSLPKDLRFIAGSCKNTARRVRMSKLMCLRPFRVDTLCPIEAATALPTPWSATRIARASVIDTPSSDLLLRAVSPSCGVSDGDLSATDGFLEAALAVCRGCSARKSSLGDRSGRHTDEGVAIGVDVACVSECNSLNFASKLRIRSGKVFVSSNISSRFESLSQNFACVENKDRIPLKFMSSSPEAMESRFKTSWTWFNSWAQPEKL
mmetsp:Transcript_78299/g.227098  ORF Transcript_78299/g.227098 Transcript_78299/m.227098 type:complete len:304 (+) Transcript_78299:535-1446(+)